MPEMQNMQPYFDAYQEKIKRAKNSSGMTLQELSDKTGVPYNNICTVNAGSMKQPLLYYSAATCKVLGLSLDELFGLHMTDDAKALAEAMIENQKLTKEVENNKAKNHQLAIENAKLTERVKRFKYASTIYRPLIFGLIGICAILLCAVIGYIIFDIQLKNIGLFKSSGLTVLAVFLAIVVVAAIALIAFAAKTVVHDAKIAKRPQD